MLDDSAKVLGVHLPVKATVVGAAGCLSHVLDHKIDYNKDEHVCRQGCELGIIRTNSESETSSTVACT